VGGKEVRARARARARARGGSERTGGRRAGAKGSWSGATAKAFYRLPA